MSYGLYIGRVVGVASSTNSRLQVRILPHMETLEAADCPIWPSFFRDELYTGKENELVWCICDDEFNNGYVLGLANYAAYSEDDYSTLTRGSTTIPLSIPKESLQDKISDVTAQLLGERVVFSDIKVTYWDSNCIHFIERSTGGTIIAYSSGSILIMRPTQFYVHIGGISNGTSLKIDSTGVSVSGSAIKLQAPYVGLGTNPSARVVVTNGSTAEGSFVSSYVKA